MKVQLMLTCLCDAFFGEVGIAAVQVLEAAGCEVVFPENQTCCGQPPYNAGDWAASRKIANYCVSVFDPSLPVVTPSGSCTAMVREGYHLLGVHANIQCFEIGEYLVKHIGVKTLNSKLQTPNSKLKVAFHRACHGRGIGLKNEQEILVSSLPNVELVSFAQSEQCCGFGGAFAATHGKLSSGIGDEKLRNIIDSGAEILVSGDMGCLMHLNGLIEREKLPIKTKHYLQLLAEALPA